MATVTLSRSDAVSAPRSPRLWTTSFPPTARTGPTAVIYLDDRVTAKDTTP